MDIKNIVRTVIPFANSSAKEVRETSARVKTDDTTEREGNGQQAGEEQQKRRNLTPEELDDAVKHLQALPGLKDNNLSVRLEHNAEGIAFILVTDGYGKVVRRIPESEISTLVDGKERKSGHLLNRAM